MYVLSYLLPELLIGGGVGLVARAQVEALGRRPTALVAVATEISNGHVKIVPDVLVAGGGNAVDGLAATLIGELNGNGSRGDD